MPEFTIKFYSEDEMNQWITSKAMEIKQKVQEETNIDYEAKLHITTRKYHPWSEFELNFIIENLKVNKKTSWIAKSLHRTIPQVNAKITQMRKKGLNIPLRNLKAGEVRVSQLKGGEEDV